MANVVFIDEHLDLNKQGCNLIVQSKNHKKTIITSTSMRWLTMNCKNKDDFYTEEQKSAYEYINYIADNYAENEWDKLNMDVLLMKNPIFKKDKEVLHIKKLIEAGADVRYKSSKSKRKIIVSGNTLFLCFTNDVGKIVNNGILYTGRINNDPVINYYNQKFNKLFDQGRKITIDKRGRLCFDDGWVRHLVNSVETIELKEYILLLVGAILGAFLSLMTAWGIAR